MFRKRNNKDYKDLSIREFTKAAGKYEGDRAGIYKMCRISSTACTGYCDPEEG